ncbi:hypothetical protein PR202_ga31608 [Eleusine coracana subsp. coracana]|uniref:Uncharacterized protein n=1 Tax=Eleusine coracana subsp. coracana TaxID=191504 RepID=A0AAV5DSR9_ELECO|nr:hypothetical protein PR202_ga31608 [Eleusine coracana subsp. coracana]
MYKQGGGAGLDRKRISEALDKHLEKAVAAASPSTSRGSAGGGGRDHHRLVVPSSASSIPKGRCSEGNVAVMLSLRQMFRGFVACLNLWRAGEAVELNCEVVQVM